MKIIIDPRQSGLSGDMIVSALTDFFACHEFTNYLLDQICSIAHKLFSIQASYKVEKQTDNNFHGSKLNFQVEKDFGHLTVFQFYENFKILLDTMNISKITNIKVIEVLEKIILAEKIVHGKENSTLHEIHFHELNSIDTIIDITVSLSIIEKHHCSLLFGLPTGIGSGTITFSHGTFQQPAPAVAKLLEITSYPIISKNIDFELTTPTGLAILSSLVDSNNAIFDLPSGKVLKIGLGLGQKQQKGVANFLRIWSIEEQGANQKDYFENDAMVILETHIDDASGELLGNFIETYATINGIKDASIYPLIMKKNRPGHCIRLLIDPDEIDIDDLSIRLMKDTGSLGVRHYPVSRHKSVREIKEQKISLGNENFSVRVKISKIGNEIIAMKPEYDDIKAICLKTNKSFKEIQDKVLKQLQTNT